MGNRLGVEGEKTVRAAVSPTPRNLEWAAAFIEGEGRFNYNRGSGEVTAVQKDPEPIVRLRRFFGGSVVQREVFTHGAKRAYWHWCVTGARARGVMMTLYSLMLGRRKEQIRRALGIV